MRALQLVLRLREGALLHAGPPCSSWVFLNAGTSRRNSANPAGDSSVPSVRAANARLDELSVMIVFVGWYT